MSTSSSVKRKVGAALAVLALTLVASCSSGEDDKPDLPKTATGSLEQLAKKVECKPNMQTDADELRQANCKTGDGKYVLATFATDRGLREWINTANDYGGTYLVGRKWVAVGDTKVVDALRGKLGGSVETGADHSGSHGGTGEGKKPEPEESHSGHEPEESHSGHHGG